MRTRPAGRAVKIGGADIREDRRRVNGERGDKSLAKSARFYLPENFAGRFSTKAAMPSF